LTELLWEAVQRLDRRKFVRVSRVAVLILVLAVGATPSGVVEASLINVLQRPLPESLRQGAIQEITYLQADKTKRQVETSHPAVVTPVKSSMLQSAAASVSPGRPGVRGEGIDKSTAVLLQSAEAFAYTHPIPMIFSDFTVASYASISGRPVGWSRLQWFLNTTQGATPAIVINNVKVVGLQQNIANLTWTNVVFVDSMIGYNGGPIRMANVTFINCTFAEPVDPQGATLIAYLSTHQGQPVNAYAP
jgi:hypothetical protein